MARKVKKKTKTYSPRFSKEWVELIDSLKKDCRLKSRRAVLDDALRLLTVAVETVTAGRPLAETHTKHVPALRGVAKRVRKRLNPKRNGIT